MNALFKKIVLSGLLLNSSLATAQAACDQVVCANVVKANKICAGELIVKDACNVHTIRSTDFMLNDRASRTVTISEPGYHQLCDSVDFDPITQVAAAIVIDSDDVVLDLNGNTLNHVNDQTQVTGIVVNTGHHNVTILGNYGAITNFSQRGIYIQGGTQNVTIGNDAQLLITGCGFGTPVTLLDGNQPVLQAGIQFGDMFFLSAFGFPQSHGLLEGLIVKNVVSTENNTGGALGDGADYYFYNCSFSRNKDSRPIWSAIGYQYFGSSQDAVVTYGLAYFSNPQGPLNPEGFGIDALQFENCSFNGNIADASVQPSTLSAYCDSFVMAVNFSNLKMINCSFCNNEARLAPRPDVTQFNQTRGCVISGGTNNILDNCEFSGNLGGGLVDGLNISGLIPVSSDAQTLLQPKSFTIRNCVASNNKASTNGAVIANPGATGAASSGAVGQLALDVVGFVIRYPNGLTMSDCIAEDNTGELLETETNYYVFTDGVLLYANIDYPNNPTNNVEIRNLKASRNRNNAVQGTCSGVHVLDGLCENITIIDSTITENSYELFQEQFFAAGVDLTGMTRNHPTLTSVINCVISNHSSAGIFTSLAQSNLQNNILSFNTWGILLAPYQEEGTDDIGYPNDSSVLNNTLLSNGVAIEDQASQLLPPTYSTSLVSGNLAFNNQVGYLVTYEGGVPVPVDVGTLPAFPPYPPSVLGTNLEFIGQNTFRTKQPNSVRACTFKAEADKRRVKR